MKSIEIGQYTITWIDEDYLKVDYKYALSDTVHSVIVCGGDMETLLNALFITTERVKCSQKGCDRIADNGDGLCRLCAYEAVQDYLL